MTYIVNAQSKKGDWIYIKNPMTLNLQTAIRRAKDFLQNPQIKESEVVTTKGEVIKTFKL
jgi:hypothetical protein